MERDAKLFVAGHRGTVGSAIVRALRSAGHERLLLASSHELDLRDQSATEQFFRTHRPDYVFHAAGRVGGILANDTRPAEFLYDNLQITINVLQAAHLSNVRKLLLLGSTCIYPRLAPQPIPESSLLTGSLESTNEWYAVAKIAGIKMSQAYRKQYGNNFINAMPTNIYGPGDNFDDQSAHVLAALMRRFHEAALKGTESVQIWGSGTPRREFLHVDDLAEACLFLMHRYDDPEIINVGAGKDISILELASMIAEVVGYKGRLTLDPSKPDGTPRKLVDTSRMRTLGWRPKLGLREGIAATYSWFTRHYRDGTVRL